MPELYDYQKTGSDFLFHARYGLLGDEQGIGKTAQAIDAMKRIGGKAAVVCPAMLKGVWRRELEKWSYNEPVSQVKSKFEKIDTGIYICSYEMLKHLDDKVDCIIFDECHYIKNPEAKRTKLAHGYVFANRPQACFALSGTPIKNNAPEFYSILKLLSYCPTDTNGVRIAEKSQYAFSVRFSYPRKRTVYTPNGEMEITKFEGQRNLTILKNYLKGKYLRRLSKNVLELPPMVDKEVPIGTNQKRIQARLSKAYELWEDGEKGEHIMSIKVDNAMSKVPFTAKYVIDMVEQGETAVIFTDHVPACISLFELFQAEKIPCDLIHGNVNPDDRDDVVADFQIGKTKVLVCTIGAASTGFTLTATRNLVFNDISWDFVNIDQARKRIHRVSQTRRCIIHYITNGDMDGMITERVMQKEQNLKRVL